MTLTARWRTPRRTCWRRCANFNRRAAFPRLIPPAPAPRCRAGRGRCCRFWVFGENDDDYEEARADYLSRYESGGYRRSTLFAGAEECIQQLSDSGWQWGVVTNKPRRYFSPAAAALDLPPLPPSAMVAGDDVTQAKPSPAFAFGGGADCRNGAVALCLCRRRFARCAGGKGGGHALYHRRLGLLADKRMAKCCRRQRHRRHSPLRSFFGGGDSRFLNQNSPRHICQKQNWAIRQNTYACFSSAAPDGDSEAVFSPPSF